MAFLGKPIPDLKPTPRARHRQAGLSWLILVAGPVVIIGSLAALAFATPFSSSDPVSTEATTRSLGNISSDRALAAENNVPLTANATTPACTTVLRGLDANKMFPIIPPELRDDNKCPSSRWNLDVARYFAYKALTIINWLASTVAVILTVYAGLLYIGGFASEGNIKKAKSILIASYVGLVIVILARVILYGSIQTTLKNNYDPGVLPEGSIDITK